jgi:urea transporter
MSVLGHPLLPDVPDGQPIAFWRQCLRGLSCCAFQTNEITGLIFIAALLSYSWHQAVFFVVAVVVGTAVARLLTTLAVFRTPTLAGFRDAGILGFNAALMGIAIGNFFTVNTALWVTVVVMAVVVAVVTVILARWLPFPFLAAPFILGFWALWPFATTIGLHKIPLDAWPGQPASYIPATFASLGSTLFAPVIRVGILFLVGVLVANWRHGLVAAMGGFAAVALAIHVHVVGGAIDSGYVGFNAVLAALVACVVISSDIRLALLAALVATWIFSFMDRTWPAPALASGFVLGVWAVMILGWINRYLWASEADEATASEPTFEAQVTAAV